MTNTTTLSEQRILDIAQKHWSIYANSMVGFSAVKFARAIEEEIRTQQHNKVSELSSVIMTFLRQCDSKQVAISPSCFMDTNFMELSLPRRFGKTRAIIETIKAIDVSKGVLFVSRYPDVELEVFPCDVLRIRGSSPTETQYRSYVGKSNYSYVFFDEIDGVADIVDRMLSLGIIDLSSKVVSLKTAVRSTSKDSAKSTPDFYRFKHTDGWGDVSYRTTATKPDENLMSVSELTPLYKHPDTLSEINDKLREENTKLWGWVKDLEQKCY